MYARTIELLLQVAPGLPALPRPTAPVVREQLLQELPRPAAAGSTVTAPRFVLPVAGPVRLLQVLPDQVAAAVARPARVRVLAAVVEVAAIARTAAALPAAVLHLAGVALPAVVLRLVAVALPVAALRLAALALVAVVAQAGEVVEVSNH